MPRKKPSRREPSAPATASSSAPATESFSSPMPTKRFKFRSLKPEDVKQIDNIVSDKMRSISESRKELLEWHPRIDIDAEIDSYWGILTKEEKRLSMDVLKNYLGSDSMALVVFEKGLEFLRRAKTLNGYTCPVCEYVSATINQWEGHIRQCFWNPSPSLYKLSILQNIEGEGGHMSDEELHDDVVMDYDDVVVEYGIGKIQFDDGWWDSVKERKTAALSDFIGLAIVVENLAARNFNQIGCLRILRDVKKMDSPKTSLLELKNQLEGKTGLNGFERLKLVIFTGIIDRAGVLIRNKKITDKAVFDAIQHHQNKSEIEMSKVAEDIKEFAHSMMQKQNELASACVYDFKPQLIALFRIYMQRRLEKEMDWHLRLEKRLRSDFEATRANEMSKFHKELEKNAMEIEIMKSDFEALTMSKFHEELEKKAIEIKTMKELLDFETQKADDTKRKYDKAQEKSEERRKKIEEMEKEIQHFQISMHRLEEKIINLESENHSLRQQHDAQISAPSLEEGISNASVKQARGFEEWQPKNEAEHAHIQKTLYGKAKKRFPVFETICSSSD